MQRVDYDQIAHLYDEPLRDHDVDLHLLEFLKGRLNFPSSEARILDIGCGTGKQLQANRMRFPKMFLLGVDKFGAMLRIARTRCNTVLWVQADGAELPFASETFDYACNQFSYPHIGHTREFVLEVFRVLAPGGRFVMTNIDPWSMKRWIVYRYFPAALELDYQDFLPVEQFVSLVSQAGFRHVRSQRSHRVTQEDLRDFLAFASERHRASQMMAIADDKYRDGLRQLRRGLSKVQNSSAAIESEFCLVTITADKPA